MKLWGPSLRPRGTGGPLSCVPGPPQGGGKCGARQQPLPSPEAWPWQLLCLGYSGNKPRSDGTEQLNSAPCSGKNTLIEAESEQNPPAFIRLNDTQHPFVHLLISVCVWWGAPEEAPCREGVVGTAVS